MILSSFCFLKQSESNTEMCIRDRFCLCLPAMLQAQDKDDSKYLAGAVPEVADKYKNNLQCRKAE